MKSHETIALQCPSCGNSSNILTNDATYGLQLVCGRCGTTSVLILRHRLHPLGANESVCACCGRVNSATVRFCQCGASLQQTCISCGNAFPAWNQLCDSCGWPRGVHPDSPSGLALRVKSACVVLNNAPLEGREIQDAIFDLSKAYAGDGDALYACFVPFLRRFTQVRLDYSPRKSLESSIVGCFRPHLHPSSCDSCIPALERLARHWKLLESYRALAQWVSVNPRAVDALIRCIQAAADSELLQLTEMVVAEFGSRFDQRGKIELVPVFVALLDDGRQNFSAYAAVLAYCGERGHRELQGLLGGPEQQAVTSNMYYGAPTEVIRAALEPMCGWFAQQPAKARAKSILEALRQRSDWKR